MATDHDLRRLRYFEWLQAQQIQYGFAAEISNLADRVSKGVRNDTPPVERWHRILPTVRLVENVRAEFGPTIINSAFRSTLYNIAVGGVGDSRHNQNDALDISVIGVSPVRVAAFLKGLRDAGEFKGGIGVYAGFTHIDTRGSNADWTGR